MSDVFAPQPVKTKTAGDVVVNINSGQTVGLAAGSAKVGIVTTDQTTHGTTDLVAADITKVAGAAISQGHGTAASAIRVELPTDGTGVVGLNAGSAVIGKVGIDQTTPGTTNLVALAANQSVNNTQIAGVAVAVGSGASNTGTQRVILATDQATLPVSSGLSGTVVDDYLTSAALAAGATVTLDSTQIASGTGSLVEVTASSSVALKVQVGTWDGSTFTVKRTFFTSSIAPNVTYTPSRYDEIQKATGATAKFRVSITNQDNTNAADVYASTTYWR